MTQTETGRISAAIRNATFTVRRRGLDEDEVRAYLLELSDTVQGLERENATLRAEQAAGGDSTEQISDQAVLMFSEAQKVADSLIDDAVVHARDLMSSARLQQRDIVKEAHQAAEAAVRSVDSTTDQDRLGAYDKPIPEVEYVRTFAKVAQIQLRSVLEALTEQVDNLGEVPRLDRDNPTDPPDHPR